MKRVEVIGAATLYLGDCRDVLPGFDRAAAIVSDPPYGIAHVKGSGGHGKHNVRNIVAIVGDNEPFRPEAFLEFADCILWGGNHFAARLPHGRWLAWDKLAGIPEFDSFSDVEFAWRKGRGKDRVFSHMWKGICQASERGDRRFHPTQKPVALMRWCIAAVAPEMTIIDPFMGSGTTGVAAVTSGRTFIGCELDPTHFAIACRRIEQAQRQSDMFIESAA